MIVIEIVFDIVVEIVVEIDCGDCVVDMCDCAVDVMILMLPLREMRFSTALRERSPRSSKALIHILCDVARHEEIRYKYLTFVMYLLKVQYYLCRTPICI